TIAFAVHRVRRQQRIDDAIGSRIAPTDFACPPQSCRGRKYHEDKPRKSQCLAGEGLSQPPFGVEPIRQKQQSSGHTQDNVRLQREEQDHETTSAWTTQCASKTSSERSRARKKATGRLRSIRSRFSLGCPEASQGMAELEAMLLVGIVIFSRREASNTLKALEATKSCKTIKLAAIIEKD